MSTLKFTLNGKPVSVDTEPQTLLVELLRGPLALTGTHIGCDTSQCGACTVLVDGDAVKSCSMLALQAAGRSVTTVEGLAQGGERHPIQEAFIECHGLQCGFCTPGMLMSASCLLAKNPNPSEAEIGEALEGNLCRCTGYTGIVNAVKMAAGTLSKQGTQGAKA